MKEIIKNSLILCLITLIAGLFLGGVYEITKEPRKEQENKTKEAAYKKVFSEADSFKECIYDVAKLETYLSEAGYSSSVAYINQVVTANSSDGAFIGYVITVSDKEGYGGEIKFTLGIKSDGTINGISFLTLDETAGVGMKAKESKFMNQFKGKKVDSFTYVKSGAASENEIDAISGATVTTNAVTNGVNAGIVCYKFLSQENGGGINE